MKRIWKRAAALLLMLTVTIIGAVSTQTLRVNAAAATTNEKGTITVSTTANSDGNKYVTNSASVKITEASTDVSYKTYQVIYATYDESNVLTWHLTSWANAALTTTWGSYTTKYDNETAAISAISSLTGTNTLTTGSGTTQQNEIVNRLAAYIASNSTTVSEYTVSSTPLWSTSGTTSTATLEVGSYLVIPTATDWAFLNMLVSVDVSTSGTSDSDWILTSVGAVLKGSKLTINKTVYDTESNAYDSTADAQIGSTLNYQIKVDVPKFASNDSKHVFYVTDVATNLKINSDASTIVVTAYPSGSSTGTVLTAYNSNSNNSSTAGYKAEVKQTNTANDTLTVTFTDYYYNVFNVSGDYPYSYVIISYEAELLSTAVTYTTGSNDGNSNTAKMTYEYDHNSGTATSTATVYTYALNLTKTAANDTTIKLSDASFKIYYYDGNSTPIYLNFVKNSEGSYSMADSTKGSGDIVEEITTSSDGTLTLTGLNDGVDYFIVESQAPSTYSLNTNILSLNITESASMAGTIDTFTAHEYTSYNYDENNTYLDDSDMTWKAESVSSGTTATLTLSVTDTKLSTLPATGSVGIIVFTIVGVAIMILALVLINSGKSKQKKA